MTPDEQAELLIEATLTAYRDFDRDGMPMPPPAWWDLAPEAREAAHVRQMHSRALERALDPRGWSSTVHVVMGRLR